MGKSRAPEDSVIDGQNVKLDYFWYGETDGKFWEANSTNGVVTTRWGTIGETGQSKASKKYRPYINGKKLARKKVSAKIGEGYVQKKGLGAKGAATSPVTKTITKKAPATPATPKKAPAKKAAGSYLFQGTAPSKSGGKFWRIKVAGKKFTTEYGKVGKEKAGFRSSTKEFATAAEATKEAEKLIKRKSKDYS